MIERADVIRHGAALRLHLAGGRTAVVRQKDLTDVLGEFRTGGQRFAAADIDNGGVTLVYGDGTNETLSAELLLPPDDAGRVDLVVDNAGVLMTSEGDGDDRLGIVRHGAVCIGGGRVRWVGAVDDLPESSLDVSRAHRVDARGRLVTPGLVDPHTHPMFAGDRADEFGRRAAGQTYRQIAEAGGGIAATLGPTRAASLEDHVGLTRERMARALAHGTTTCEAKSGYDLTVDGELRLLEAALVVDALSPMDLVPTLLGAHLIPPERIADRAGYVDDVAAVMIPAAAERGLAASVDVYCDEGAFTCDETRTILEAARAAGLGVRAHVGQFADLGGAELLAELGALSADHVENISQGGIEALAAQGVVAVMLPGACVQLRMAPPPVEALRTAGVALALGTDLNPGTSLTESLPLQMWLATTHYGMTVDEAWLGVTRNAARALGRHDIGRLVTGARGDVVVWDAETPAEVAYHYGVNLVHTVIKAGRIVKR
jgi:imidazolonepropionase